MAHPQQARFFEALQKTLPECFCDKAVLEVGSFDVNGSVRQRFHGCRYVGIDLVAGPGVDEVVTSGHDYAPADGSVFDVVLSTECFEHNPYYFETFMNMVRLTKPGGLVVFTSASRGRPEHGTRRTALNVSPGTTARGWDYYRNLSERDFTTKLDLPKLFDSFHFFYNPAGCDLYFLGTTRHAERPQAVADEWLARAYREIERVIALDSSTQSSRLRTLDLLFSHVLPTEALYQEIWGVRVRPLLLKVRKQMGGLSEP